MAEKVFPAVKADEEEAAEEEIVDPQKVLRKSLLSKQKQLELSIKEECAQKPDAQNMWSRYQECNDRVNSRSNTTEICSEELIDYLHVLDHCVTKDLFKRLK